MTLFSKKNFWPLGRLLVISGVVAGCFSMVSMEGNAISVSALHAEAAPLDPVPLVLPPPEAPAGMTPPASPAPMAMPESQEGAAPENAAAAPALMPPAPPNELTAAQSQPGMDQSAPSPDASGKKGLKKAKGGKNGKAGADMPVQPANILPLPKKYLIVRKEHDADELASRLTAARTSLAYDQNGAALELFNELYAKYPKDKRVLIGRAVAMQRLGKNAEALSAYEEALNQDPKNIEALTNMLGLLNSQDPAAATDKLQQLLEIYPFNADITAQLGMSYGAAGDYEKSLKYLEMADSLKPGNADILYNRAVTYDLMGKTQKAADLYHQIVVLAGEGAIDQNFPIEAIKKRLAVIR